MGNIGNHSTIVLTLQEYDKAKHLIFEGDLFRPGFYVTQSGADFIVSISLNEYDSFRNALNELKIDFSFR